MLCSKCQGLASLPADFFHPLSTKQMIADTNYTHESSLKALKSSAVSCAGCQLMLRSFSRPPTEEELQDDQHPIILRSSRSYYGLNEIYLCHDFWVEKERDFKDFLVDEFEKSETEQPHIKPGLLVTCEAVEESIMGTLEFFVPRGEQVLDNNIDGREIFQRSDANECIELANTWLHQCVKEHPDCSAHLETEPPTLPTRVLDLGSTDGSQEPYLLETKGQTGLYAALSHCWGKGTPPLTTETHNLLERKGQIPMAILPLSFQDAITITRRLNIRYLWIDSLCIIQNSAEDWRYEAQKMAQVFGNCHVCIAALSASNSNEGIFHMRDPASSFAIDYSDPTSGSSFKLGLRLPVLERDFPIYTNVTDKLISGPLDERAWVLQERILSPRVLKYGSEQMVWECQTLTLCESRAGPLPVLKRDIPSSSLRPTNNLNMKSWRRWIPLKPDPAEPTDLSVFQMWYTIVGDYCNKKLTHDSDKLPAISGLAAVFAAATGCEYVAGLWKEDLGTGMLWIPVDTPQPNGEGQADVYRAPSWSWSSTNYVIAYRVPKKGTLEYLAEVIAVARIPKVILGKEVEFISVEMRGPFQEICSSEGEKGWTWAKDGERVKGTLDFPKTKFAGGSAYGVLMLRRAVSTGWLDSSLLVNGLVLMESSNGAGQKGFRRIGLTSIENEAFVSAQWEMRTITLI